MTQLLPRNFWDSCPNGYPESVGQRFCGDTLDLSYKASDVQSGYKNGDLAYWPPAKNFVIFVKDEEKSASIGNLVILGHVDEPQAVLNALQGTLKVEIAKAQ